MFFTASNIFSQKVECKENLKFKECFYYHVKYVENNINSVQGAEFRKSLIFIYNYAHVSVESIMNYARIYPENIFKEDLKKWLDWYEDNKCKNIQFKKTYLIPEVY